ncbi:hypothetical protein BKC07_24590 [Peribacillus simplex]|nr:hypothetical protein BKC07_24590 [Peribacillus simplex]
MNFEADSRACLLGFLKKGTPKESLSGINSKEAPPSLLFLPSDKGTHEPTQEENSRASSGIHSKEAISRKNQRTK